MSGGDVRPVGRARALWRGSPRRELTMTLLLGAIGAGIIFLATRQTWAQVHTVLPRPLPDSRVSVTGAALVPSADALVVAGLATLAGEQAAAAPADWRSARGHRGGAGGVGIHAVGGWRRVGCQLGRQPGDRGCRVGHGWQRHGDQHRPGCRRDGDARAVLRGRLAGAGRDRSLADDRGRPAGRLAGQPDGRHVQPVRRSRPWHGQAGCRAGGSWPAARGGIGSRLGLDLGGTEPRR